MTFSNRTIQVLAFQRVFTNSLLQRLKPAFFFKAADPRCQMNFISRLFCHIVNVTKAIFEQFRVANLGIINLTSEIGQRDKYPTEKDRNINFFGNFSSVYITRIIIALF